MLCLLGREDVGEDMITQHKKIKGKFRVNVNVHVGLHTQHYTVTEEHAYNLSTRETTTKTMGEGSVGWELPSIL